MRRWLGIWGACVVAIASARSDGVAKYPTVMRLDVDPPAEAEVRLVPGLGRAPVLQLLFRYRTPSGGTGRHRETIALDFEPTCTERRAGTAHTFYVGGYEPDADGAIVERWTFTDPQPRVHEHAHGREFESEMSTAVERRVAYACAVREGFRRGREPLRSA